VNEPTTSPERSGKNVLGKKDKKFLAEMAGTMAALMRQTYQRNLGWLDLMEVTGRSGDGRLVSFALGRLSHLTSHQPNPSQSEENPPDPKSLPACIHFQNGDFIVMADRFDVWEGRLEEARWRAYKRLMEPLERGNERRD
jgi:hypothetical protein